jgi:adenine-specific DNA-methyltransferase
MKCPQPDQNQTGIIHISTSKDKTFRGLTRLEEEYQQAIFTKNGHSFIRIPSSLKDMQILHVIDSWPNTLHILGLEISPGPVVHFRAKEYLCSEHQERKSVPLLWMHNLQEWNLEWPLEKNGKHQYFFQTPNARKWLIPVKNYVLLKRFISKEQHRRLYASVLFQSDFQHYQLIGLENHLNYIHRPKGNLTAEEIYGLVALFNTGLIDVYFRALNGNTQVNASDMRILPLPSIELIRRLGKHILQNPPQIGNELDKIVAQILQFDSEFRTGLNERR